MHDTHKIVKEIKTRIRKKYRKKILFNKFPFQSIITSNNWKLDNLLDVTPAPYVYIPDYQMFRHYEDDVDNLNHLMEVSATNKFMYYTCQEDNDAYRNRYVMVVIPDHNFVNFYSKMSKFKKLKAFL